MDDLSVGTRVEHERYGEGLVSQVGLTSYDIFFERGGKIQISKSTADLEILEETESSSPGTGIDLAALEEVMIHVLDRYGQWEEEIPLGEKWIDGKMILEPSNGAQAKEIPIETFFHKIVMLRDRLRVLEQNINSHDKLNDEEKVNLQQYITRIYGSLTTFNVLFGEKEHYFSGSKK